MKNFGPQPEKSGEKSEKPERVDLLIPSSVQDIFKEDALKEVNILDPADMTQEERREEYKKAEETGASDVSAVDEVIRALEDVDEKQALEQLRNKFEGNIFVDIGPGSGASMFTKPDYVGGHEVAKLLGAKAYVAVEPNFAEPLAYTVKKRKEEIEKELDIPISIFKDDGVSFLKKLQDSTACVFSSYLDSTRLTDEQYVAELENEIARVVGEDKAFLDYRTVISPRNKLRQVQINWQNPEEDEAKQDYRMRLWEKPGKVKNKK